MAGVQAGDASAAIGGVTLEQMRGVSAAVSALFVARGSPPSLFLRDVLAELRSDAVAGGSAEDGCDEDGEEDLLRVLDALVLGGQLVEAGAGDERSLCLPPPPPVRAVAGHRRGRAGHDASRAAESVDKGTQEAAFWDYFKDLVSEWNPCYSDEGSQRFVWDPDVGAHDVDFVEPERSCLRAVLDKVFAPGDAGGAVDLTPVRELLAALVQTSARHDLHLTGPPKFGVHACA